MLTKSHLFYLAAERPQLNSEHCFLLPIKGHFLAKQKPAIHYYAAGSNQGMTLEELLQRMQAQSSLPVEAQQIREALMAVTDDVIQEGARFRHKNAIEVQ